MEGKREIAAVATRTCDSETKTSSRLFCCCNTRRQNENHARSLLARDLFAKDLFGRYVSSTDGEKSFILFTGTSRFWFVRNNDASSFFDHLWDRHRSGNAERMDDSFLSVVTRLFEKHSDCEGIRERMS